MKIIGVIPARGGSKGIPNKNKKLLHGKPLIQYTIEAAIQSNLDEIIVSSDDDEILEIALSFGVKIHKRPIELSGDLTPTQPVLIHVMDMQTNKFDALMTLQPTSPLRTYKHINEAIQLFTSNDADSLVSIVKIPHNFLPQSIMLKQGNFLSNYELNSKLVRRQEKPTLYARNGAAIYITKTNKLIEYIIGGKIIGYEMSKLESVDIDDHEDWELAELLFRKN